MTLLYAHALATIFMAGVIWFVQVVHYPLFAAIDPEQFPQYEKKHTFLTTFVVMPPMFVELGTAIWLVFGQSVEVNQRLAIIGLILVGILWLSTFLVQVPCHRALEKSFDVRVIQRLIRTNWLRTALWSVRAVLSLWMIPSGG